MLNLSPYVPQLFISAASYGAQPDAFFTDGVSNTSTTFTSATANFTSADVGKTIGILRAGSSNFQPHWTTIASVSNATTVILTNATGRSQSNCRFYISRAGDQTTSIQAAIDAAALAGGGTVILPGVGYLVTQLILKNRVWIMGAGMMATRIHELGSTNLCVVINDQTLDNSAMTCGVLALTIDGNRVRQSNTTTTLNGGYTAGASTITLTSTASITNSGTLMIVNATTKAITGAANNGSGQIRITATTHGFATGDMVTIASVGGTTEANSRWVIDVIDANSFDLRGSTFTNVYTSGGTAAWTVFLTYQAISGSTVTTVEAGMQYSTDHSLATASAVTQAKSGGIYFATNPFNTNALYADQFDGHWLIRDVFITNVKGEGIAIWGQSEARMDNVWISYSDDIAFHPSYDTWMSNCTADNCGRMGFYMRGSSETAVNCKAFFNGGNIAQEGHGFFFDGPTTLEEGCKVFSSCASQDNRGAGVVVRNAQRVEFYGSVSSNSTSGVGYWPGVLLDGATNAIVEVVGTDRNSTAKQTSTLKLLATSITPSACSIIVKQSGVTGGGALSTPIAAGSILTGGNDIQVNAMGGTISTSPAGAGTYTPDPYAATTHLIQMPAGNITVAIPSNAHLGCEISICIIQDGGGSRLVTWGAYKFSGATAPTLTTTASRRDTFTFLYNGTSWQETSRDLNIG